MKEQEPSRPSKPSELTELLEAVRDGRDGARDRLFSGVYDELLQLARREFRGEKSDHTLQPTALVSEAWMRLDGSAGGFENRREFFGAAARAMRRILIDHARRVQAEKRDAGRSVTLLDVEAGGQELAVLEVDDALQALERHDSRLAELVQLRFFGGLTIDEVARLQDLSPATIKRDWNYARAWLFARMEPSAGRDRGRST